MVVAPLASLESREQPGEVGPGPGAAAALAAEPCGCGWGLMRKRVMVEAPVGAAVKLEAAMNMDVMRKRGLRAYTGVRPGGRGLLCKLFKR